MTTLVLLHALGASGGLWNEVVDRVGNRFDCFAPDLPGFGRHAGISNTEIADTLDWLTGEIAARAPSDYVLVGHSMGGKFATLLAAHAEAGEPALKGLSRVVLLAASPPAPEPMDEERAEMIGWAVDGAVAEADARRFVDANVAAPLPSARMVRAVEDVRRSSPAAWTGWLARGAREDWADRVGRLTTPALIIAGEADDDLGEMNQRRLNIPHYATSRIAVVPHAAHLLPYEQSDIVGKLILEAAGLDGCR